MKNFQSNNPCIVCGLNKSGMVTFHHIYTQKAYPEYKCSTWNLLPVCKQHHNEIHNKGTNSFCEKYPQVKEWMIENGWVYIMGKWIFDGLD